MIDNAKIGTERLFDALLAEILRKGITACRSFCACAKPMQPAQCPRKCSRRSSGADAILSAIGDWELLVVPFARYRCGRTRGIPAVGIMTDRFEKRKIVSSLNGLPDYPFVMIRIPWPITMMPCCAKRRRRCPRIVELLTRREG